MSQKDTKKRILDAAERLFAREGFHSTSLRMLTKEAGVNLAAVNYHFGSKEELIKAVIERRLLPLNKLRVKRLQGVRERAQKENRLPGVRETLLAFLEPTFAFRKSGKGAQDFITLVSRSFSEPDDTVRTIFMGLVAKLFQLFYEVLCEALPELPRETILAPSLHHGGHGAGPAHDRNLYVDSAQYQTAKGFRRTP
jgi:AcrR family transcriptional regulator